MIAVAVFVVINWGHVREADYIKPKTFTTMQFCKDYQSEVEAAAIRYGGGQLTVVCSMQEKP